MRIWGRAFIDLCVSFCLAFHARVGGFGWQVSITMQLAESLMILEALQHDF